ncbi:MAG: GHKL domain-containing protein [Saprospiraceae bacterium]|nr:GHKL domain-containing protein [Saprospiraceae bacterium]
MNPAIVLFWSFLYLVILFLIAIYGNNRAKIGKSIVNNPYIYSLSLAVYCTVWTYYGSVGRAATQGVEFVAVYLGPTVIAPVWMMITRKIVVISKYQRITSIADFISSRYGISTTLGVLVSIIAVIGIIPYISIQLKAIGFSFETITTTDTFAWTFWKGEAFLNDKVFYVAILLTFFTIVFGTRNLDPNERHEGLMSAIAFESLVKLVAFLCIGMFVCFGIYKSPVDLFTQGEKIEAVRKLYFFDDTNGTNWFWIMVLSSSAILFLPRQFHVAIVENTDPNHIRKATWMFPLYLFLISLFVLPIACAGKMAFAGTPVEPDNYVLSLPLAHHKEWLALLVYLGGFSAAISMVVVSVIALSIMVSNNIVMPIILQSSKEVKQNDILLSDKLLSIRRIVIVAIIFSSYLFYKFISKDYSLVSIGLISFAAIIQFAPSVLGGLYWIKGNRNGAVAGLVIGFLIWAITLPLPTMAESHVIGDTFLKEGYFGFSLLKPNALFGIEGMDTISHATMWSLFFNIFAYCTVSLLTKKNLNELKQADLFVNIEKYTTGNEIEIIQKEASVSSLKKLLEKYLGIHKSQLLIQQFGAVLYQDKSNKDKANHEFIQFVEKHLSGSFGAASAKLLISSTIKEKIISIDELNEVLNQTKQILEYSNALEIKSEELKATTQKLREANDQLTALDQLKAEFISTVTHELRTPITSIRSLSQILLQHHNLPEHQRNEYLSIVVKECARISRLINQVLDVEKLNMNEEIITDATSNLQLCLSAAIKNVMPLINEKNIDFQYSSIENDLNIKIIDDKFIQILINLLSNAIKFCDAKSGKIWLDAKIIERESIQIDVSNNGLPISIEFQRIMFDKFTQQNTYTTGKPEGSGLGLFITKRIIEKFGGKILVHSDHSKTTFSIVLLIA